MAFRRSSVVLTSFCRKYSNQQGLVGLAVNDQTGIATVTLQRPPVNSLNLEVLSQLSDALTQLEKNKCRGMVLSSSSNSVFSAGLDILEMYKPDKARVTQWWSTLQDIWIKLYGTSFPTAAAVAGHAPAGGCLLALSCEYRVMANNFTIGLNETQLGIVAPSWFVATMVNVIGTRQAELALTLGKLFKTDEAAKIGMVDEVANSREEVIAKCEQYLQKYAKIPPLARAMSKQVVRGKAIKALQDNREKDLQAFLSLVMQDKVQKGLGMYLESLKKK